MKRAYKLRIPLIIRCDYAGGFIIPACNPLSELRCMSDVLGLIVLTSQNILVLQVSLWEVDRRVVKC